MLVCAREAVLPTDRCIKCNQPSDGRPVKRRMSWHEPVLLVLILAGVLVYVIVAVIVSKKASVTFGVCRRHRVRRRWIIFLGWMSIPAAITIGCLVGMLEPGVGVLAGFVVLISMAIVAGVMAPYVTPKKITDNYATLKGCGEDYLQALPELGPPTSPWGP